MKRKRKSRKNVVLIVAIDISGAFDAISWTTIVRNVINAHCSDAVVNACENLLIGRRVNINGQTFHSEKGTPQGGRASPALFKIGLNALLNKLNEHKIDHVAYADDLALVLSASTQNVLQEKLSNAFDLIRNWCSEADLAVNEQKTELMLTTRKRSAKWTLRLNGGEAHISDQLKYLGVVIDKRLSWKEHITYLDSKLTTMIDRVRRFSWMQADLEWRFKRKLYFNVFLPTITYASAAWFRDISSKTTFLDKLRRIQRRFVIAASGAYKSTSNIRLMRLLGVTDVVDELNTLSEARERGALDSKQLKYQRRTEAIERMERFEVDLQKFDADRIGNKYVTWCVSNSGPFKWFLRRIGKAEDEQCRYCGAKSETAGHLLFDCNAQRVRLTEESGMREINDTCRKLISKLLVDVWRI